MEQAPLLGGVKPQRKRWPFLLLVVLLIGLICAVASAKYTSHESALSEEMSQSDMKLELDTANENNGAVESPTSQNDEWIKTFFSESEEQNVAQDETTAAAAATTAAAAAETTAAAAPAEGGADTTAAAAAETTAEPGAAAETTGAAAEPGADTTAAAAAETTAAAAAETTAAAPAETTAAAAAETTAADKAETTAAAAAETTAAAAETTAAAAAETTAAPAGGAETTAAATGGAETTAAAAAETTAAAAAEAESTAAAKAEADTTAASEPTKAISMDVVECAEGDKTIVTTCTNLNKPELKDQCSAANGCKWMETPCAVGKTNINCVSTVSKKCTLKLDDDSTPEYQPDGSCPIDSGVSTLSFTVFVAIVALLW